MEEENKLIKSENNIIELAATKVNSIFPEIQASAQRAKIAASMIKEVENEQQKEAATKMAAKLRTTSDVIEDKRKSITSTFDTLKQMLMQPEKDVKDEIDRIRLLITEYVKKVEAENKRKEREIEMERQKEIAKISFTTNLKQNVSDLKIESVKKCIMFFTNKINDAQTREELEEVDKLFLKDINMNRDAYNASFTRITNNFLTNEEMDIIINDVKKEFHYQDVNNSFKEIVKPEIESLKEYIKERFEYFDELEKANESENELTKIRLEEEEKAKIERQQKEKQAELERIASEEAAKIETEKKEQIVMSDITAQLTMQDTIQLQSGLKKKKTGRLMSCESTEFLQITAQLFTACFLHPKYSGVIKRDRTKAQMFDNEGYPIMEKWYQDLLDFYANNCSHTITGIDVSDEISIVIRK